jgi:hypothetical protein
MMGRARDGRVFSLFCRLTLVVCFEKLKVGGPELGGGRGGLWSVDDRDREGSMP